MWKIDDETLKITMTKGDTPSFEVSCNVIDKETGELVPYEPQENDIFIFAVKKDKYANEPLFCIKIPNDTMIVKFRESDTKDLEYSSKYIWEVSLNRRFGTTDDNGIYEPTDDDYHCTFIDNKVLALTTEVY